MNVQVNGLTLPPPLLRCIEQGMWRTPDDTQRLRDVTGIPDAENLVFLSVSEMEQQNDAFAELVTTDYSTYLGIS